MELLFVVIVTFYPNTGYLTLNSGEALYVGSDVIVKKWDGRIIDKSELRTDDIICIKIDIKHDIIYAKEIRLAPPKIKDQDLNWFLYKNTKILDSRVKNLGSKDFWVRERASLVLREMDREEVYPLLVSGYFSNDPEIKHRSWQILYHHYLIPRD